MSVADEFVQICAEGTILQIQSYYSVHKLILSVLCKSTPTLPLHFDCLFCLYFQYFNAAIIATAAITIRRTITTAITTTIMIVVLGSFSCGDIFPTPVDVGVMMTAVAVTVAPTVIKYNQK